MQEHNIVKDKTATHVFALIYTLNPRNVSFAWLKLGHAYRMGNLDIVQNIADSILIFHVPHLTLWEGCKNVITEKDEEIIKEGLDILLIKAGSLKRDDSYRVSKKLMKLLFNEQGQLVIHDDPVYEDNATPEFAEYLETL